MFSVQQEVRSWLHVGEVVTTSFDVLSLPPPPHLWDLASFCSCISMPFFLPLSISCIQSVNKLKTLSFLPPKVPWTLILSLLLSQNCLLQWLLGYTLLWFTFTNVTSVFFLSSSQILSPILLLLIHCYSQTP